MRVRFPKGRQRKFIRRVLVISGCPSLRSLRERGFDVNYQTLKSYYNENRTLPEDFFWDLCKLGGIDRKELKIRLLDDNWGRAKGGRE